MTKSKKPSKQRKEIYTAPLHKRQRLLSGHLSKELAKKYGRRSIGIRKNDKVKIVRGEFKKKTGEVIKTDLKETGVQVAGIEKIKKDGTKVVPYIHPSNLIITELSLDDRKRKKALERKKGKV